VYIILFIKFALPTIRFTQKVIMEKIRFGAEADLRAQARLA
jgi:hypothetical protein